MEIKFHCIHCGQSISVTPNQIGQQGACPGCNQPFIVPTLSAPPVETASAAVPNKRQRLFEPYMAVVAFVIALLLFFFRECRKIEVHKEFERQQRTKEEQLSRTLDDAMEPASHFPVPTPPIHTAESHFTNIKLPHGIQLELPKTWWLIGKDFNALIETSAQAALDLSGITTPERTETLIAANSMPRTTYAAVRVTYVTPPIAAPEEFRGATAANAREIDPEMEAESRQMLSQQGLQLLKYLGTTIDKLDGNPAMVINYRRSGPNGPVLVWTYQVLLPTATVRINLSYRESEAVLWKPVIEKIRRSFTFTK